MSASGKLECEYCGSVFDPDEIEALYADKTEAAAEAGAQGSQTQDDDWNAAEAGGDWGQDAASLRAYNCPSCGAELICDETTAATSCPYCGNPTVIPSQVGGTLRPDYIIPFKLDKAAAVSALKKHYRGKLFLPRRFSEQNHLEEIRGVYVPFWLFSATADADITYHATRSHTHREGDYRVTVTEHFDVRRAGTAEFRRIPADGSSKMPDDLMDSIEPFDYTALEPFKLAYLPGYLADKYDVTAQESEPRATERCRASVIDIMRGDVHGYEAVTPTRTDVRLRNGSVRYALLPVWLLNTKWNGKDHLFAMNGQTGRLVGDLPVSPGRFAAALAILTAVFAAAMYFLGVGPFLGRMIAEILS